MDCKFSKDKTHNSQPGCLSWQREPLLDGYSKMSLHYELTGLIGGCRSLDELCRLATLNQLAGQFRLNRLQILPAT